MQVTLALKGRTPMSRLVLFGVKEALQAAGLRVTLGEALVGTASIPPGQTLELDLLAVQIALREGNGALELDAPFLAAVVSALGGPASVLQDGRARWRLRPGHYGPVTLDLVEINLEVV